MNMQKFTQKSIEAIGQAQNLAVEFSHQQIEQPHLMLALLEQENSEQLEVLATQGRFTYYRVLPDAFASENVVTRREMKEVDPMEVHKYTVVMWLEGDDPDSTDELINGHAGVAMQFRMLGEEEGGSGKSGVRWADLWNDLRFWDD